MNEPARRGRGRPSAYTPELAERVLELLADGLRWREIEAATGVSVRSIMRWAAERPSFDRDLAAAKSAAAEHWATVDTLSQHSDPQRARVAAEQAKWLAARWAPGAYGDKVSIAVEHTLDIAGALNDARQRLTSIVDITPTTSQPLALGSSVTPSWPQLEDQPAENTENRADWLD
jgi:hypothetical protein